MKHIEVFVGTQMSIHAKNTNTLKLVHCQLKTEDHGLRTVSDSCVDWLLTNLNPVIPVLVTMTCVKCHQIVKQLKKEKEERKRKKKKKTVTQ